MPSSLHDANTAASPHPTMSAASTASTTNASTTNFRFAHPYTQQPTWACSTSNATVASPHTPTPENTQTDVKDASTTPPVDASTITTMLSGNTQNDATELFRQALKPQDYRASSAFVQHVVQQLLETVDRRRPLSHLRSFVTPEILDNVEHFSAERNHALITLTGQSQTNPGIPALQPAPLRLLRLHLRARRLNPQESAEARAQERQLPPGYHAALRPGQQAKPSNAITAEADLRVEICGTYRDGKRVKAFAGAAERRESKWRLTAFNFI